MDYFKIRKIRFDFPKYFSYLLPHQGKVVFCLIVVLLVGSLYRYTLSKLINAPPMEFHSVTSQNLEPCTSVLCQTYKRVLQNHQNIVSVASIIIEHNLRSYVYLVTDKNYLYFFTPLYSVFDLGLFIGTTVYSDPAVFITELLFPHGLFEMTALVLFASLYYAVLANTILFTKNKLPLWYYGKRILIQLSIIILLDILAGFLEALSIVMF